MAVRGPVTAIAILAALPDTLGSDRVAGWTSTIIGSVVGRTAMESMRVVLTAPSRSAVTDSFGRFTFADVPRGNYLLDVTGRGCVAQHAAVRVPGHGDTVRVRFEMHLPEPEEMEARVVRRASRLRQGTAQPKRR